ncbi:PadR family transcriptional regulator [Gemmatimonadota bacterium]
MGSGNAGRLYGTLELLIMNTLRGVEAMHGLSIARQIENLSGDVLQIEEGALYPALHRLVAQGLIEGEWRMSEKRRRARFYTLTKSGEKELQVELGEWMTHTRAILGVLDVTAIDLKRAGEVRG